jgi:hypothetical protein
MRLVLQFSTESHGLRLALLYSDYLGFSCGTSITGARRESQRTTHDAGSRLLIRSPLADMPPVWSPRFVIKVLSVFWVFLFIAGCGNGQESDEARVVHVIHVVAYSSDPANCRKLATRHFIEQSTATAGPQALDRCEEEGGDGEEGPRPRIDISEVHVSGDRASAIIAAMSGNLKGQALELRLVNADGRWKLSSIAGFSHFDSKRLAESFRREFARPTNQVADATAACVVERVAKASQEEAEKLLFSGNRRELNRLYEECRPLVQ